MNDVEANGEGRRPRIGLVLTGGGARAAYQVGVLKAVAEMVPAGSPTPFSIICGTSAGAINAACLASGAGDFHGTVERMIRVWERFRIDKVFRTEASLAVVAGLSWFLALFSGGMTRVAPRSLLDNSPLRRLLDAELRLENIQRAIEAGQLHAVSITAAAYYSGHSVTFYQGNEQIRPWRRTRRIGIPRPITLDHLMASTGIPILFPAVRIGYEYYGDGSMRQTAPVSPALHLGADRLLVIGVRNETPDDPAEIRPMIRYPSIGQISSYILDTLFMDSLSMDLERLKRINHTLHNIPPEERRNTPLREVDLVTVSPSRDVRTIAERHMHRFPRSVRYLLGGIGALDSGGLPLISYLLFEEAFCRELVALGHHDAMRHRHRIKRLIGHAERREARATDGR